MKHLSASWWKRAAAAAELVTEDDLKASIRDRLDGSAEGKAQVARHLGLTPFSLSLLLRGRGKVSDAVAAKLGFRRVVRFERIG